MSLDHAVPVEVPAPSRPRPIRRLPRHRAWNRRRVVATQLGALILILCAWEGSARLGLIDPFFWSQPSKIYATLVLYVVQGDALIDMEYTFSATLAGFVLGTSLGAFIGLSFWWSRNYAAVVQPFLISFESIPKLSLAPLIIVMFGIGLASKLAIATALTVVVAALTTAAGVQAIDPDNERLLYSLGASRLQVFRKLVVPSVLPWIISVLRINIGLALTGAVVGEFIASQHGLGRAILQAGDTYDIALVWSTVLILSSLSVLMYIVVSWLEKALRKGVIH